MDDFKFDLKKQFVRNVPDQDLINDVKLVAAKLGRNYITADEYDEYIGKKYSARNLRLRFKSWGNVLIQAGLENLNPRHISNKDLFENIQSLWLEHGTQPRIEQMKRPFSRFSGKTYQKRFGNWNAALEKFIEYINSNIPEPENELIQIEEEVIQTFKHVTKRNPTDRLKFKVMAEKGNQCAVCGITLIGTANMHFDHIKPWSKGGETTFDNLQILCVEHNLAKGNYDQT